MFWHVVVENNGNLEKGCAQVFVVTESKPVQKCTTLNNVSYVVRVMKPGGKLLKCKKSRNILALSYTNDDKMWQKHQVVPIEPTNFAGNLESHYKLITLITALF